MWFIYLRAKRNTLLWVLVCFHQTGKKGTLSVSLSPICGEIFERLIFNKLLNFLLENNLILPNQSVFKRGDSCLNLLLSITHEIYNSFDDGLELRNIFLDNSNTHKSILFWIVVKWYTLVTSYTSHLVFLVIENKALFFYGQTSE